MATNQEGSTSQETPSNKEALRSFYARILGWAAERADAVEHAIRSIVALRTSRNVTHDAERLGMAT